jgi:adenosylcobinamide kinase/adenosylcobinamide-phosphate guanylyltransferase
MADIILVTGGSRSGKSGYAQNRAEQIAGGRCFIATCVVEDGEMSERVSMHRQMRDEFIWDTIEEPLELAECFRHNNQYAIYLVDCLTLWVHNLMRFWNDQGINASEQRVKKAVAELLLEIERVAGTVLLVSGEVGWGIVPANELSRKYRDLVGICNQTVAQYAGEVVLVSCGLPFHLKKKEHT